ATVLSAVHHPNVCATLDSGFMADGRSYVAMELLEGVLLKDVLKHERVLSEERAADLSRQILSALGSVHQAGVIHRDIKPSNIYLVQDKEGPERVKILDYGIAYVVGSREKGDEGGRKGVIYGTATYISPEQIRGQTPDGRADL